MTYSAAHNANQKIIQDALAEERAGDTVDFLALQIVAEDGRRAAATLKLIRSRCEHDFDWDCGGNCTRCGEQDEREPYEYDDDYQDYARTETEAITSNFNRARD